MSENAPPQRVILYARVSTEDQAGADHFSIAAQITEMHEYAHQRGWQVVAEFLDEGISGQRRDRPGLEGALNLVQEKGCDVLLVHELSRLSRSVFHTLEIFDLLGKYAVGFASVKDPDFDFADPTRRLFLTILAAVNQYYLDNLRMHIRKSKRERARTGLYNASIIPYGYQMAGSPLEPPTIVPEEAAAVRLAFEQYSTGLAGFMEIAQLLNNRGYRVRPSKKYPKGRRFSKENVAEMLRNPFYMGKIVYRKRGRKTREEYAGLHEPVISPEVWEKCRQARARRKSDSRAVQNQHRVYLLSNLARCDLCRRKLRCQPTTKEYSYYREMSYERGFTDCPHSRTSTRTEGADVYIHAIIQNLSLPEDWLEAVADQVRADGDLNLLQRKRRELESRRRRLKTMKIAGEFDEDADLYHAEITRIKRELDSLPTYDDLESLRETASKIEDLPETWAQATPADRRDMLRLILREVHVDVPQDRVVAVVPQAMFIPIFRNLPAFQERDFGVFVPIWDLDPSRQNGSGPVPDLPRLPSITCSSTQNGSSLFPFLSENPLMPGARARTTPGISKALALCRQAGRRPEKVWQGLSPNRRPLPMDLRKWSSATAHTFTANHGFPDDLEQVDVLVTQFLLWDAALTPSAQHPETLLDQARRHLRLHGVWYLQELLPAEMPGHWVFQFFPHLWDWVQKNTWNLHTLYNHLRGIGYEVSIKRKTFVQTISLGAALVLARSRPGVFRALPKQDYERGLETLCQAANKYGPDHPIYSEVSMVEGWVQNERKT